jgi:hypothetical protein
VQPSSEQRNPFDGAPAVATGLVIYDASDLLAAPPPPGLVQTFAYVWRAPSARRDAWPSGAARLAFLRIILGPILSRTNWKRTSASIASAASVHLFAVAAAGPSSRATDSPPSRINHVTREQREHRNNGPCRRTMALAQPRRKCRVHT